MPEAAERIPTREIIDVLHLGRALVTSAAPYAKRGSKSQKAAGCQVDLLVQTAGLVCLVEIKRREQIGMEINHETVMDGL